jgi:tetratricopeptide (TPR) repeat protein
MITKDQKNKQAWLGVAKGLYGMKRPDDALKCVRKALTLDPAYKAAQDFEQAIVRGGPAPGVAVQEEPADWDEVKE